MAEKKDFSALVLKAVMDEKFRKSLAKNPEDTIKRVGFVVSNEEVAALKKLKVEDWENITVGELNKRLNEIGSLAAIKGGSIWIELA